MTCQLLSSAKSAGGLSPCERVHSRLGMEHLPEMGRELVAAVFGDLGYLQRSLHEEFLGPPQTRRGQFLKDGFPRYEPESDFRVAARVKRPEHIDTALLIQSQDFWYNARMRKNRFIGQDRCYHVISRLAHRAFFLDDEEEYKLA